MILCLTMMRLEMEFITSLRKDVSGRLRKRLRRKAIAYGCLVTLLLPFSIVHAQPQVKAATPTTQAAPMAEADVIKRANDLLAQMTVEEKIGQMTQLFFGLIPDAVKPEERIR